MIEIIVSRIKNYYFQDGMIYFFKNFFWRAVITLCFDINDYLWKRHHRNLLKKSPAWKIMYIFIRGFFEKY